MEELLEYTVEIETRTWLLAGVYSTKAKFPEVFVSQDSVGATDFCHIRVLPNHTSCTVAVPKAMSVVPAAKEPIRMFVLAAVTYYPIRKYSRLATLDPIAGITVTTSMEVT
jgi:hypothetical protein